MKVLLLIVFLTISTMAQIEGNPENWCRDGFFTRDSKDFTTATIKAGKTKRAYFHSDEKEDCPKSAGCRTKTYLVEGDVVVVNRKRDRFACAWYTPPKGSPTVGWIETSDLHFGEMLVDVSPEAWAGEWTFGKSSIEFTPAAEKGFLNVSGNATWEGIGANVHVGEIEGTYSPKDGLIEYSEGNDEYDCRMTMRLLGTHLIVADNLQCGGVNVTFSGVYKKTPKRRKAR